MGNPWDELQKQIHMVSSPDSSDSPSNTTFDTPGDILDCPDCGRPILETARATHAASCQKLSAMNVKKRKLSDTSNESKATIDPPLLPPPAPVVNGTKKANTAASATDKPAQAKKSKSSKDTNKNKRAKNGPVNPDEQCAVPNEAGVPCARSITCKNHSVTLKRAVQRSHPFEVCLTEWQRKNGKLPGQVNSAQAKQSNGVPAPPTSIDNNNNKKSNIKKPKETLAAQPSKRLHLAASTPMFLGEESDSEDAVERLDGAWSDDVDSEEEADLVLLGLSAARSKIRPFPGSELAGTATTLRRPSKWKAQIASAFVPNKRT